MNIDILSPEFFELADKAKAIYQDKEQKTQQFKEVWLKHKQEIAELDKQAELIKAEYEKRFSGVSDDDKKPSPKPKTTKKN